MSDESKSDAIKILNQIKGTQLDVSVKLRSKYSTIGTLGTLTPGAVVMFDESPVDNGYVCMNGQKLATGKVVQVGDHYGLQIEEVMS